MIKERNYTLFVALVNEFADKIPPASGMRGVEIVKSLNVVKRKTVVMTCGERYVSATRRLSGFYELFRPVLFHFELPGQFVIFRMVDFALRQNPFAFA